MKAIFLTSSPLKHDDFDKIKELDNTYNFEDNLRAELGETKGSFVYIASSPNNHEKTQDYANFYYDTFLLAGFTFTELVIIDSKNKSNVKSIIKKASVVLLSGGKVGIQNSFFNKINLKDILAEYSGILIGVSAGSMNCAEKVIDFPEEDSELENTFQYKGLGLTDINIIPHYNRKDYFKTESGIDVWKEYIIPESKKHTFIVLNDGSYVLIKNKTNKIFGEAKKLSKGELNKIN